MKGPLDDRVALVTGAGRGIGRAVALRLARAGAHVVVNDLDAAEAEGTRAAIHESGGLGSSHPGDVTDPAFPSALVEALRSEHASLDILVNNAGYIWNASLAKHSDEQFQAMLEVHAAAPFRLLRAFQPWLKTLASAERTTQERPRCRKVVNVSSISGTRGAATQVGYSAGKAAVVGLTKTLAAEWGRFNVTVNAVAFGHIQTRLTQPYAAAPPSIDVAGRSHPVGLSSEQIDAIVAATPLARSGTPEDAAGAIYLFCLPESDFVSGEVLTCTGGA